MSPINGETTMRFNATLEQVTEAVGNAIARGEVEPDLGHGAIGAYAAWTFADEKSLAVSLGGPPPEGGLDPYYANAGDAEELAAYGDLLIRVQIAPPWLCPDCGVPVGARHVDGCDVGRCPACGWQALMCDDHPESGTQVWTGRWPGSVEVERGLAKDLNDLALQGVTGALVWDPDTQLWRRPS